MGAKETARRDPDWNWWERQDSEKELLDRAADAYLRR
jgi:hypothetical protein